MSPLWEVVGGDVTGGILVRAGRDLSSPAEANRLCTGALVEEEELVGQRLRYKRLSGIGPDTGWISVSIKDKPLVVRKNRPMKVKEVSTEPVRAYASSSTAAPRKGSQSEHNSVDGRPKNTPTGILVVDNAHFSARWNQQSSEMVIQCFAPSGHVLRTVDDDRHFELHIGLTVRTRAADLIVGRLQAAADLTFQEWCVADEPLAITVLRSALHCAASLYPFKSIAECISEYWDAMNTELGTTADQYLSGMECRELASGIFRVEFSHQLLMASTMLRFQERYECPDDALRGWSFTLAEYKSWERGSAQGFKYYDTWSGFNVPCEIVRAVLRDERLLPRERALQHVIAPALAAERFYIIGTCGPASLAHEFGHGMYEMFEHYQREVNAELAAIPIRLLKQMKQHLVSRGYAQVDRILKDEIHAYLLEGHSLGCHLSDTALFTYRLRSIFHSHAGDLGWQLLPD